MNRIILIIAAIVELWLVLLVSSTSLALAGSPTYALNVTPEVNGTITSNPSGINYGSLCSASFPSGTSVIRTVSSAAGYVFSGWGGACSGTASSTCIVEMNQVENVNANFVRHKRSSWKVILPELTRPVLDVVGITQAAAVTALTGANLTIGTVTQQCSNTVANGLVISQNPAAGTSAPVGSAVALVVSSGKCPVNNKNNQTISFFIYPNKLTIGTTGTISTTTTSFLPATLSSATPSVCTISDTVVTAVASGTCTILANQAGNAYYNAAPQVSQNIAANNKDNQAISFNSYPSKLIIGTTSIIFVSASSSLPVALSSATPTVCTISGTVVTAVTSGTCTILANQAGNAHYNAAPEVSQNITIANQSIGVINFNPVKLAVDATSTASATATSNLPVSFSSSTPSVCTIGGVNGSVITGVRAGICTIVADQSGNTKTPAAPQVSQNIIVGLFKNNKPLDGGYHSSATRTDSFAVKEDTHGMYVTLSLCSQSASNYFKNGVNLHLLKDGNEIARKSESYDSQSNYGPIPCFDHILEFPAIWLKANDNITLETTVSSGDYKNYLTEETVYAGVQAGINQIKSCQNGATLPFSGGILANNQRGGTPIQQCIFSQSDGVAGWFSEWKDGITNVFPNYPEIICGQSPWANTSTTPLLPMVLSDLSNSSLIVDWNLENYATGKFNLTLEAWITSEIAPKPEERLYEVMVMPYALGMVPDGVKQVVTLDVGGDTFDFYIGTRSDATAVWTFYTFVPHSSHLGTASIDFGQILSWLVGHGYIKPNSALADVEFGNEIMSGRLRTVLISYTVKLNQQAVCHLP